MNVTVASCLNSKSSDCNVVRRLTNRLIKMHGEENLNPGRQCRLHISDVGLFSISLFAAMKGQQKSLSAYLGSHCAADHRYLGMKLSYLRGLTHLSSSTVKVTLCLQACRTPHPLSRSNCVRNASIFFRITFSLAHHTSIQTLLPSSFPILLSLSC